MKKIFTVLLICVLAIAIVACGGRGGSSGGRQGGSSASGGAAGSANFDQLIEKFDVIVNEYLDFMDLYHEGDDSAWDKAQEFKSKNTDALDELWKAYQDNKLSADQSARFTHLMDLF